MEMITFWESEEGGGHIRPECATTVHLGSHVFTEGTREKRCLLLS